MTENARLKMMTGACAFRVVEPGVTIAISPNKNMTCRLFVAKEFCYMSW